MNDEVGSSLKTANDSERNVDVKLLKGPVVPLARKRMCNLMFRFSLHDFGKQSCCSVLGFSYSGILTNQMH